MSFLLPSTTNGSEVAKSKTHTDIAKLPPAMSSILKTSHTHPINISWILPVLQKSGTQGLKRPVVRAASCTEKRRMSAESDDIDTRTPTPPPALRSSTVPIPIKRSSASRIITIAEQRTPDSPSKFIEESSFGAFVPVVDLERRERDSIFVAKQQTLLHISDEQRSGLGNLALCSCPGKKVRLDGHGVTKSRVPVNRDLDVDFERIESLKLTLVVNLLDDAELDYLGAGIEEYRNAATSHNVSILRFPLPDGGAPKSYQIFHQQIIKVMDDHLSSGKNVLCHCRGGIGRAGLVACCWLLFRKVCTTPANAIKLVRLRRSPKAIETVEQEMFIAGYYQYLKLKSAEITEIVGTPTGLSDD